MTKPDPIIEYVSVSPNCVVPPLSNYTEVSWENGLLIPFKWIPKDHPDYDIYDAELYALEDYQKELVDDLVIHRRMLIELCRRDEVVE